MAKVYRIEHKTQNCGFYGHYLPESHELRSVAAQCGFLDEAYGWNPLPEDDGLEDPELVSSGYHCFKDIVQMTAWLENKVTWYNRIYAASGVVCEFDIGDAVIHHGGHQAIVMNEDILSKRILSLNEVLHVVTNPQ